MYDETKWQNWAVNILRGTLYDDGTGWIYETILATGKQKLFEVIAERRHNKNYFAFNNFVLTEIIQGYYFCQCLNKK